MLKLHSWSDRRGSRNFSKGGLRRKILKEKCLLIQVSTCVHIKTRQTCNSFSLLPFQEDCLLFFALFYYSLLFLKFERGGGVAIPVTHSLQICQCQIYLGITRQQIVAKKSLCIILFYSLVSVKFHKQQIMITQ